MKILYCSYSQIPSDYANSIAVMKQCSALNKFVCLRAIFVRGKRSYYKDLFPMYGVASFPLIRVPKVALCMRELGLRLFVLLYSMIFRPDVVYSRDIVLNAWLCRFHICNIYEIHQIVQQDERFDRYYKKLLSKAMLREELKAIVCISKGLADECVAFGIPKEKITVLHSATDTLEIEDTPQIQLPLFSDNRPLAVYVGSLQEGKGIEQIEAMSRMSNNYNFLIVGGKEGDVQQQNNLRHIPHVSHAKALSFMKEADFLLLPMTEQSYKFHSPLKLFEYLSTGKPVIASDTADIREILKHRENGMLAQPGNPKDFLDKMDDVRTDPELQRQLELMSQRSSIAYTWESRAKEIVYLIRRLQNEK